MSYYNPYPNPNINMQPIFNNQNQFTQANQQRLIPVNGIEGARAYQMGPNDRVPLFDSNEDICYIKSTDGAGFATIDIYDMTKRVDQTQSASSDEYVTRSEFNSLKGMIEDVKQHIWPEESANEQSDSQQNRSNQKRNGGTRS